jgi:dihydropyrimidine dehydrogenase (NAD+) subunit PreA
MADLSVSLAGIKSPNPFWLSSGPVTNTYDQMARAFEQGWGGAVWKTIGDPVVNVSSRLGGLDYRGRCLLGLNNIELISDRPIEDNLKEVARLKKRYPKHAVVVSLMVEPKPESWRELVQRTEDAGCDGLELNFSCPHGMGERGMGAAIGQDPEITQEITSWAKEHARTPVIVKLTPNITNIQVIGRAAKAGGADALALINTISSFTGVDLETFTPLPAVAGRSSHGGYCGPAVKPIALNLVAEIARDPQIGLPISGIGGIETWRDALEFILLGCSCLQVQTAVMHYGFRIVEDMIDGLNNFLDERGYKTVRELIGVSVPKVGAWGQLDLSYQVRARVNKEKCIGCQLCYIACLDGGHQAIDLVPDSRIPLFAEERCVGCNLCSLICPVQGCITMQVTKPGRGISE